MHANPKPSGPIGAAVDAPIGAVSTASMPGLAPDSGSAQDLPSPAALAQALRSRRPGTLEAALADQATHGAAPLPPRIVARLIPAQEAAQVNAARIEKQRAASGARDLHRVLAARAAEPRIGPKERVKRLRRLYDAWARDVQPHSACRSGCSHCCHVGVAVSQTEAELIAQETGARMRQPATGDVQALAAMQRSTDDLAARPRPCTFLTGQGRCGIYESRPLACRQLHNLDADDLLCQLIPGAAVPVPYADATDLDALAVLVLPDWREARIADIRVWFGELDQSCAASPGVQPGVKSADAAGVLGAPRHAAPS